MSTRQPPIPVKAGYNTLVKKVSQELKELEFFIKQRTAHGYWNIGKHIHDHLLANKERAQYGETLYERLAKDVGRDVSTLQRSVQFYRAYPIPARGRELSWTHYRRLITIKDANERKMVEEKVISQQWDATKLQEYLNVKRGLAAPDTAIPQLTFTRGRLQIYRIVTIAGKDGLFWDLGFRLRHICKSTLFKKDDCAERKEGSKTFQKVTAKEEELFTYPVEIVKVIDGDTVTALINPGFGNLIEQKLRLRGIDCPEIDTKEGLRAKRFVEARLKRGDGIVVKTYKDRSDKFDRYLADIFYPSTDGKGKGGAIDPEAVAQEGIYLNQELLNAHLAVKYES